MAAFGDNYFATPFGAIAPAKFFTPQGSGYYDFSGFSSRQGFLGFSGQSGISGFSSFCEPEGLTFLPYKPTLTFPMNYVVLSGQVPISWKEAIPSDPCDVVVYELQITMTFSLDAGWRILSSNLPAGTTSYVLNTDNIPYTEDGGLRIRAKNTKNLYSDWSTTPQAFTIANHAPNPVTIVRPLPQDSFDYCIPVNWKEASVKDVDGQSVTYSIEITDQFSSNGSWTSIPGALGLAEGTVSYNISSFDFPDGEDYGIRVYAIDSLGLASSPAVIGPISIKHEGSFIVDTLPPEGSLSINDGAVLAAYTKVKLTLSAFDATTGVKDVRFKNAGEDCWSDFDTYTHEKFWDVPATDGVKRVFVQYRDYAGNLSEVCDCDIVSRVFCDEGNVTDIEVFNNSLFAAFDTNGNLVEYRVLVNRVAQLPEPEITALARFGNFLYLSTYDSVTGAVVYSYDSKALRQFTIPTSKVLSMITFNDVLYLGLNNGRIMSYDGTTAVTVFVSSSAITRLRTDGAVLYATVQGGGQFLSSVDGINFKTNLL